MKIQNFGSKATDLHNRTYLFLKIYTLRVLKSYQSFLSCLSQKTDLAHELSLLLSKLLGLKLLWTAKKRRFNHCKNSSIDFSQISEILLSFPGCWFSQFSQHSKPFLKLTNRQKSQILPEVRSHWCLYYNIWRRFTPGYLNIWIFATSLNTESVRSLLELLSIKF